MAQTIACNFVSVWDGGVEVISSAVFHPDTGLVSELQTANLSDSMLETLEVLEREYIIVAGQEYEVERDEEGDYYALRPYTVTIVRFGCAQVKARTAPAAMRQANIKLTENEVSWSDDWTAADAQLEEEEAMK